MLFFISNESRSQFNTVYPLVFNAIDSHSVNAVSKKDTSRLAIQTPTPSAANEIQEIKDAVRTQDICKFSFPLRKNVITSGYGWRYHPVLHRYKMHYGIDLRARFEPVYAMCNGIVSFAGYGKREGNYINVVNGKMEIIYAHLSQILVKIGDNVESGQNIAYSGASGMVTGPHLHVGIKLLGSYVDPLNRMGLKGKNYGFP